MRKLRSLIVRFANVPYPALCCRSQPIAESDGCARSGRPRPAATRRPDQRPAFRAPGNFKIIHRRVLTIEGGDRSVIAATGCRGSKEFRFRKIRGDVMRRALLSGVAGISLAVGVGPAFADPPLPNLTNLDFADYTGNNPKDYFTHVDPTGWTGGSGLIFIAQNSPGHDATVGPGATYFAPSGGTIVPAGGNYVEADGNPIYESGFNYKVTGLTVGTTYTLTFYQGASQWVGFSGATTNQWVA